MERAAGTPHLFGIRHHGPGCARSLLKALQALQPDCLLVEGPPEAEALLPSIVHGAMQPPVAWLSYCPDDTGLAVYHPFATFSPEWQALRWAVAQGVPVRLMDLPLVHGLALERERREALQAEAPSVEGEESAPAGDEETPAAEARPDVLDPLGWLARAAGHADGESWWNYMVEERGDGEELFAAIAEAMVTLRSDLGDEGSKRDPHEARMEALREAHMRQCLREAQKAGHRRIAVVCGAWHLGALQAQVTARADQQLLKGLPKVKVNTTWIPWTFRHLARRSGYGAGVASPGWYEHLWAAGDAGAQTRTVGWLARVARLMREKELDCSSAHLIEAARLAESLAALRERPLPGLQELNEATRTVLCMGDDTTLRFIEDALVVGDRLGAVPPDVPAVPLQRDVEQLQKSLRLKPEALARTLDLDLRNANDLARSHLLHRLRLLDVPWGELARTGRSARGTFHEVWSLQWQPEFLLRLVEASRWGRTVLQAATAKVVDRAAQAASLDELARLVDQVLLAELPDAVQPVTQALENRAAMTGDALQLLAALPPLANVFRYGSVRQTDASLVSHVLDGIIVRACISLPLACGSLDDAAAESLREQLLAAHGAVGLRGAQEQTAAWHRTLSHMAGSDGTQALIAGLANRLLLDAGELPAGDAATSLGRQLSPGAEPGKAAAWLDGFLNRNAQVLLHDTTVWSLVDGWLGGLSDEHFLRVLPLVRRTFAGFGPGERRDLGTRARSSASGVPPAAAQAPQWDAARAELPVPTLRVLLGMTA